MTVSLAFEDILLVTYALRPERVRPLVPASLALDTVEVAPGETRALVSAVAFRVNRASTSAGLSLPVDVRQLNLRTYVRPRGQALYFIRMELAARPLGMLGEIALRGAAPAPIYLEVDYDEVAGRYRGYELRCESPAGKVSLLACQAEALPPPPSGFASWESAAAFVTERPIGLASSTLGGYVRLDVDHAPLEAQVGQLVDGRLRSLERLGVLSREQALAPHSVLLKRRAVFTAYPPRPILVPSGLRV